MTTPKSKQSTERSAALARAAGWPTLAAPFIFTVTYIVASIPQPGFQSTNELTPMEWLMPLALAGWTLTATAELTLATIQAADYPRRTAWNWFTATAPRAGHRMTRIFNAADRAVSRANGLLVLTGLALLGPAIILGWRLVTAYAAPVWGLALVSGTLAELAIAVIRVRRWHNPRDI